MTNDEILSLSAIVAAYIGMGKMLGIPAKFAPVAALVVAAGFVLAPDSWRDAATAISVVGLGASGLYQHSKSKGAK
ncbi:hypothetical protein [Paenibacillus glycanilyticus]|uniref:hypothetical protein n=1 Tax=Paenibacillus glycanilyticus TaxID=126569 RepID=UPI001910AA09|nr:hypothetical protein [Paenibacillus glycanilyticus]